jgi:cytochrome P450
VRRCIGAALAWAELKVAVSTIVQAAELEAPSRRAERIAFRGPTLRPARGARVVLRRRRESRLGAEADGTSTRS